jgi:protein tyrosine phosphatase (PTP) superfamily phosphohydrolase (DUF442 family)
MIVSSIAGLVIANSSSGKRSGAGAIPSIAEDSAEVSAALPLFRRLNETYTRGSEPNHGGVTMLARLGVKTVVDLRSPYDYTADIGEVAHQLGLGYHWLPMSVWDPPTDEQANEFVRVVSDQANAPVFVFCSDGLHRTGELSAIYRVAHDGWSVEQALAEMDGLGFNPYYYSLRQYVWTWARKFQPSAVPPTGRGLSAAEK